MYILLSGRVSVHYRGDQSAVINEEMHELMNVKSNSFIPVKQNVSDIINQELGPQVGQLGIYIYAILFIPLFFYTQMPISEGKSCDC